MMKKNVMKYINCQGTPPAFSKTFERGKKGNPRNKIEKKYSPKNNSIIHFRQILYKSSRKVKPK